MAAFRIYKFQDLSALGYFLNGGITCGSDPGKYYGGIVGKTLIFTQPASHTVTFTTTNSQIDPTGLSFQEVKSQIEAVMTGIDVLQVKGTVVMIEKTVSAGVTITNAGTANGVLGVTDGAAGKVFSYPPGNAIATAPHWVQSYFADGYHVLVTRE